ncbi:Quinone oxidoreductase-like protein 2 [Nymphon striatum]|nr:Quinone oxidoreductase-like protein 2 [Nymphon striatum]
MSVLAKIFRCSASVFLRDSRTLLERNELINPVRKLELHRRISSSSLRSCQTHSAAVLYEFNKELKVEKVTKTKKIKPEEVRVDVYSCGVNAADALIVTSDYEIKPTLPFIPGFELSGEVTEVGSNVTGIKPGDRIIGLNKEKFGGFSEEAILDYKDVWKMPQSMAFDQAAAIADCYSTALIAARRANIKPGDLVLVTAAAGGLGLAAVDIAANLFKAKVIGACGTEDKATLVREKGAFSAVNYKRESLPDVVKKFSNGKGVKVVFDAVGGDMFESVLDCVSHEGSVIVAGFASRKIPAIQTSRLLPKSCALIGVSLSEYRLATNDVYRNTVSEIINLYGDQYIEPHISATFPLNKACERSNRFCETTEINRKSCTGC